MDTKPYLREDFYMEINGEWHPVGEMTDEEFTKGIETGTIHHAKDLSPEFIEATRKRKPDDHPSGA